MLHNGGAELIPVELFPEPPLPPIPPPTRAPNGRDNMERTVTIEDQVTSNDDVVNMSGTTSIIFSRTTTGHTSEPVQIPPTPPRPSAHMSYIVGPMMYIYLSAANSSDAGFTVDLLFQHPSYFEVNPLFILLVLIQL